VKLLVLFDIDGTLLDAGGLGLKALQGGLRRAFALSLLEHELPRPNLAGATDSGVMRELFAGTGVDDTPANRAEFLRHYTSHLGELFREAHEDAICALPGVVSLLEHLVLESQYVLGLLTGNAPEAAEIKLSHLGLHEFFTFGAFGTDHELRDELGAIALERAQGHGHAFEGREVLIIGDTPRDVSCARAVGASCLAVATGSHSAAELEDAGATYVFADLGNTPAVIACLEQHRRKAGRRSGNDQL